MVWYQQDQYEGLKQRCTDSHLLPPTYAAWLKRAEKMVRQVEDAGGQVAKVTIDTDLFVAWCKAKQRVMDAESRTLFAIEAIQKQQFLNTM